jgi:hypothetical protein
MAPSGGSHSFEARLQSLKDTIVEQPQSEPGEVAPSSKALLIRNELLVSSHAAPTVQTFLKNQHVKFARLTSLLRGDLKFPPGTKRPNDDVEVWRLLPPHPPVITLVEKMWAGVLKSNKRAVTPNHVLIPASWGDQCPFGPPTPSPTTWTDLHGPHGHDGAGITMIDAGYQWDLHWGTNPLAKLVNLVSHQAYHPVALTAPLTATAAGFQGKWAIDRPDKPDYNNDGRLDALAGHANFVLGVLGQYASYPTVTLWNHFGGFYPDPDEYTRELSVCRSLILSRLMSPSPDPLINLGFAFSPLKDASKQDVLSIAWDLVFQVLGTDPTKLLMFTPAGNQGTKAKRYPGALNTRYPGKYPNVMAVASHDLGTDAPSLDAAGKIWSNYGNWIAFSAIGADVTSTFLPVKMATEDDVAPYPVRDFTQTETALWTGTCFAAPKVTASVAEQFQMVGSLSQAVQNVISVLGAPPVPDLGYVLPI